jgi:hypothetical protein
VIDNPNLLDVGAFARSDDLRAVAAQLLREVIDLALDDPNVKQALAVKPA